VSAPSAPASAPEVGRFAPSSTGPAHPGTLLAALLCWLDARSRGVRLLLRLEDLDPQRARDLWSTRLEADLAWLGLDFDAVERQSGAAPRHEEALDRLAAAGRLYPCRCTRSDLRRAGHPAPDGGFAYPGTCRGRPLPPEGWRASPDPLRVRLPEGPLALRDESGLDLSQDPVRAFGDPVVRRRDGAVAYHLASVVDDAASGVTRVVRGRDLALHTATQVRLRELLGIPVPVYRHHLLLLEERGGKLAKLHGAVDLDALRPRYDAPALVGFLARAAGLRATEDPVTPAALRDGFRWEGVADRDRVVRVTEAGLALGPSV
jgi:glutamyl-tRNA synthetase/glutamyl-Q tRNA(Asp) synthetase